MAATTITFTYGINSVVLDTPDYPENWSPDLDQWTSQSIGGAIWTNTRSTSIILTPVLHWALMPDAQHTNLYAFIFTTVVGSANAFTFTDWDSTVWDAQYLGGMKEAEQSDYDAWKIDLKLRVSTP